MPAKAQTYKGMKDYLPGDMRLRQYIISTLTAVATRYGFEPMQTPIVEYEDTIAGKLGDDEKLIYRLQYGDDRLALRYDQTVSLARVIAQYPNEITLPFRRWAVGPSYRGERQQRGRFREFYQFDLDTVGAGGPLADAEIIAVISEALQALGFRGFRVLLNNREILSALARVVGVDEAAAGGVYRAIDKFDKIGAQGVREQLLQGGIAAEAAEEIIRFTQLDGPTAEVLEAVAAQLGSDARGAAAVQELRAVVGYLQDLGIDPATYDVAPRLARGLSYYTGTVFEAVIEQPPIGSLLGGGRYDNLIGTFADRAVPTVGTAFGIERLQIVMTELGLGPQSQGAVTAYVTIFSAELAGEALRLASELRRAGIATITALAPDKLGKQLKEAAVKTIPFALIVGPDELAKGEVVVRDLRSGEQRNVRREAVVGAVGGT
ncbi:MAG: histidine--tRNA ligase [Herpetosiphonaceae bacterium]|nr:histidine--tRNA ligase [Herpetosiphonaceae bacterium]